MKDKSRKLMAFTAIAVMVAASIVPVFMATQEAEAAEPAMTPVDGFWDNVRLSIARPVWGFGDWVAGVHREPPVPSGNDDAVKAYGRNVAMIYAIHELDTISGMAGGLVDNDRQTWQLAQLHVSRAAEIAASSLWQENKTYDPEAVLDYGGVYGLVANGNYNTQHSLDFGYRQGGDRISIWKSSGWSAPIGGKFVWNGGSTPVASERLSLDWCTIVEASASGNRVYVVKANDPGYELSNTLWAYGHGGTITSAAGGPGMALSPGKNDISSLESGWYVLTPGTYGGPLLPSVATSSVQAKGGITFVCDGNVGYAIPGPNGLDVWYNGAKSASPSFRYSFSADGKTHLSEELGDNSLGHMIGVYGAYVDGIKDVLYKASQAGQVMWTISSQARKTNALLSPSSVVPQLVNVGINADQAYAMYVSALDQIAAYNNTYGETLKAGQVKISEESLDLYCYGSLYNPDGSPLAENVVFTPYCYIRDMQVKSTGYNTYTQDGICMVWDSTATSASGWLGSQNTSEQKTVLMCRGAYFEAKEVIYKHRAVDSILLKVKEVTQMETLKDVSLLVPPPPKVLNAEQLIMIIVLELGAIIALLGWAFKTPQLMIAGGIVAIIGIFASGFIADVALGTKGFWSWLPFWLGGK